MFIPKTDRIEKLAKLFPKVISDLEKIFDGPTNIYIDWSNVIHWQDKLKWNIDLKRMKQLFDSFDTINSVKIYTGTLEGNQQSEDCIPELEAMGYSVTTKPVKLMRIPIDMSSIPKNSPSILKNFIKKSLLSKLAIETIEYLNGKLEIFNKQGIFEIEEQKCNFDVEMGRDMLRDFDNDGINNYILWSVDSDFAGPVNQIRSDGKNAVIFATSGKVSTELDETGTFVFDIKKIKEFICWPRDLSQSIKDKIKAL
ncbi:MAG TPA: NYN domain-containing protein [Candidatus Paceibacterota bacterium]|jgi:uncharacterized LabA/DUF88 family protein|nr:NYN domain-containing protein [Candidatus Paceibacterota bacterium]